MVKEMFGFGKELHNLADEAKDELKKEEHEVKLSKEVVHDFSDALEAYEDIAPAAEYMINDIDETPKNEDSHQRIQELESKTNLSAAEQTELAHLKESKTRDPHLVQAEGLQDIINSKTSASVSKPHEAFNVIKNRLTTVKEDLEDAVSTMRDKDNLFDRIGKEDSDIEAKLDQIENKQLTQLEQAEKKAELMLG